MTRQISHDKMLYSVAEAATLLSLSRPTLYKLIQSGRIIAVYPTSKARISAGALDRYVAELESQERTRRSSMERAFV